MVQFGIISETRIRPRLLHALLIQICRGRCEYVRLACSMISPVARGGDPFLS